MRHSAANSPTRLRWLARAGLLWSFALVGRLIQLQVVEHDTYQATATENQVREITVEAPRGEILDRNGHPLAMNVPTKEAVISLKDTPDLHRAAQRLARVLSLNAARLETHFRKVYSAGGEWASVKRRLLAEEVAAVEELGIDSVAFRPDTRRVYPNGTLAANVIGWVFEDAERRERVGKPAEMVPVLKGAGGLEYAANRELTGSPGKMRLVLDARGRRVISEITEEPTPGKSIRTTLDIRIQHVADEALRKAVEDNRCFTGSAVVMDPNSGDVLAMSSYPTFDPNEPVKKGGGDQALAARINQAIANRFEPGSVFKVITFAAALESTGLRPSDIIDCGRGVVEINGRVIHDHDRYDRLTAEDVLAKSSNTGTINIARMVGLNRLVQEIGDFGFGKRPNIGLPGEAAGLVPAYKAGSLGYVAIGHEIAVTNLQLARAASVVANGGELVAPRIVGALEMPGGAAEAPKTGERKRILKPETSITLRRMMEHVVLAGTGKMAKFTGYSSGGKTGSAQLIDPSTGRYSHSDYNASFMGFAPVQNPNVVVVVTLNGAHQFGGVLAAPVFSQIASAAMRVREIRRDLPDDPEPLAVDPKDLKEGVAPPEQPILRTQDLRVDRNEALASAEPAATTIGPRVPDFRGKTLTAALSTSTSLGIDLDIRGRGLVRNQSPAPGAVLGTGKKLRLDFAP